jgi:integrase
VPFDDVKKTLPRLNRIVRAMVELQLVAGMRPMEVRLMRPADIDRKGIVVDGMTIWVYRPSHHKLAWKNKRRAIALGPRAQSILVPFLDRPAEAWLFSPAEAEAERRAAMRAARKTPVQPSQQNRRKAAPKRTPADHYGISTYASVVLDAARKAGVPDWTPGQLRKAAGTEIEDLFDLDHARAALGHDVATTTKKWYAKGDLRKAAKVAARIG